MTRDVTIKEAPEELVATIHERVALAEAGERIPDAFRRLWNCVGQTGYDKGMPGIVTYAMKDGMADLDVFMPVTRSFEAPDDVIVKTLPGGRVATITHIGPYDEVGPAYATVAGWIAEHGHRIVGPPRERYLNDPQVVGADKAETEVEFPIEP